MKIKIDLHTHCMEATGDPVPKLSTVKGILAQIKKQGLDGIALTDHDNKDYGLRVKEIVDRHFTHEVLIIPGQEISLHRQHVVELYLPGNSVFRFCAHPIFGSIFEEFIKKEVNNIHGIEIQNGAYYIQEDKVKELAERYDLITLENSDAHSIGDIGLHYNEIDLEILKKRCQGSKSGF
ncbi:PHP domain-containing protein [Thermodesulfobacteriota bacterium]